MFSYLFAFFVLLAVIIVFSGLRFDKSWIVIGSVNIVFWGLMLWLASPSLNLWWTGVWPPVAAYFHL